MDHFLSDLKHAQLADLVAAAQWERRLNSPAMNEIVRRFTGLAHRVAYEVCWVADDHDDVVNEALLELVQAVRAHRFDRGNFAAYAQVRMRGKARRVAMRLAGVEALPGEDAIEQALDSRLDGIDDQPLGALEGEFGDLTAAVAGLPPGQQTAVRLRFLADWTVGEIARLESVTPGAVSQRLHAAYHTLRQTAA